MQVFKEYSDMTENIALITLATEMKSDVQIFLDSKADVLRLFSN